MTTQYVMVGESAAVEGAIAALKNFEGPLESVHVVYLVSSNALLTGAVPLARILLAEASAPLKDLSVDSVIAVQAHADQKTVIDLFHKYNLVSLPVVDEKAHLLGVITADDIIELMVTPT